MVDPWVLLNDIGGALTFLALGPALALLLFLVGWERPQLAAATGFDRRMFWFLAAGGIAGSLATLLLAGYAGSVLGISLGGGVVPVLASIFLVRRVYFPDRRSLGVALRVFVGLTAILLVLDELGTLGTGTAVAISVTITLCATLVAVAAVAGLAVDSSVAGWGSPVRVAAFTALAGASVFGSFAVTSALPGVGIISTFPAFLIPPVVVGVVAVWLAPSVTGLPWTVGPALGYATATFGSLVGADVLRQPPLWGSGSAGILSIGGAGVFDLLYLSGLLAAGSAFLVGWTLHARDPVTSLATAPVGPETPGTTLRESLATGMRGDRRESLAEARQAVAAAEQQARDLGGLDAAPDSSMADDLPLPRWLIADRRNLDAVIATGRDLGPVESFRAWLAARHLVVAGQQLAGRRRATFERRGAAFAIDLVLILVVAGATFGLLLLLAPDPNTVLTGVTPYVIALIGAPALAVVYFVVGEAWTGATLGKRLFRLRVSDRRGRPPGPLASLARNLTRAPALAACLTLVGLLVVVGGSTTGGLLNVGSLSAPDVTIALAVSLAVTLGLTAAIPWLAVQFTEERQRFGDLIAGTWVVSAEAATGPARRPAVAGPFG